MNILFIGKRFNTNRDALLEKFGRNYQFPLHLSERHNVELWLVDYHGKESITTKDGSLRITSTSLKNLTTVKEYYKRKNRNKPSVDMVIASGDCYIGFMAYKIAKKINAKFVFDVYDKYDEFGGYIRPLGFNLFGYILEKADLRLFASRTLLHELGQGEIDTILNNGIDAYQFHPIDQTKARQKLQLSNNICYVGYFGSMEPDRGVQDLIKAVELLSLQGCRLELLLGGRKCAGIDLVHPRIRYLGNIPFSDMPVAIAACDVLAVPYRRSPFMDAGASNKIAEIIACQRPIVATTTPNLTANFPEQAADLAPYLAEPSNPPSLAEALKRQVQDRYLTTTPDNIYWPDITINIEKHLNKKLIFKK